MSSPRIARVIVTLALDRTFDYEIPPALHDDVDVGCMVSVPFGNGTRDGYVIALPAKTDVGTLKAIETVHGNGPLIPRPLLKLGEWIADYYCCTREQAVQALLPAAVRSRKVVAKTRNVVTLNDSDDLAARLVKLERTAPRQAAAIKTLVRSRSCSQAFLTRESGVSSAGLRSLVKAGTITISEEIEERDPFSSVTVLPDLPRELSNEQATALARITTSIDKERKDVVLLYGVTGSGKTEVYLQAIAHCLDHDLEAIVLVPEIALTPQTTERFRARFGDQVSVLHSRLSDGERFDEWTRIRDGRVSIVVGARSALFAPFQRLGLIVVDEEHETSYKQDKAPRYQARDVAVMRGHLDNVTVVLGTATPSLESFYNVQRGKYTLAQMSQRIEERDLPTMEIVDMAAEAMATGQPQHLSRRLISAARDALDAGEQVMLFLNRRGYSTRMQCLKCGHIVECDDCSMAYTFHREYERLMCHLCGAVRPLPATCPECSDAGIQHSGLGIQKIESMARAVFPGARIVRMDSDTMSGKDAYRKTLTAFRAGEIDILIGTQMIAKGLDFPNVTLVGIIFADLSLNLADFRAGERTFQLLVQVAGRAGRGDLPGRVIVQTYTPYHPVLRAALKQDYTQFYESEVPDRGLSSFPLPPHGDLFAIQLRGPSDHDVAASANDLYTYLRPALEGRAVLNPPRPSGIAKRRGYYYYHMLASCPRIAPISRYLKRALSQFKCPRTVQINVDIDPYTL